MMQTPMNMPPLENVRTGDAAFSDFYIAAGGWETVLRVSEIGIYRVDVDGQHDALMTWGMFSYDGSVVEKLLSTSDAETGNVGTRAGDRIIQAGYFGGFGGLLKVRVSVSRGR